MAKVYGQKCENSKRRKPALKNRQDKIQAKYKLAHYRGIQSLIGAIKAAELRRQGCKLGEIRDERRMGLCEKSAKTFSFGLPIMKMETRCVLRRADEDAEMVRT